VDRGAQGGARPVLTHGARQAYFSDQHPHHAQANALHRGRRPGSDGTDFPDQRLWKNHGADDDNGLHQRRAFAVPMVDHIISIIIEIGGAILLIIGFQVRIVAAAIAIFLSPLVE
jgi:DoxX